jgi:hypothetical protein
MPLGKDRKDLEEGLRDNMVTAFIDHAIEFGKIKAKKPSMRHLNC